MNPPRKASRRGILDFILRIMLFLTMSSPFSLEARKDITLASEDIAHGGELSDQLDSNTPRLASNLALETQPLEIAFDTGEDSLNLRLGPGCQECLQEAPASASKTPLMAASWEGHRNVLSDFQNYKTDPRSTKPWGEKLHSLSTRTKIRKELDDPLSTSRLPSFGPPARADDQATPSSDSATVIRRAASAPNEENFLSLRLDTGSSPLDLQRTPDTASHTQAACLTAWEKALPGFQPPVNVKRMNALANNVRRGHARPRILRKPVSQPDPSGSSNQAGPSGPSHQAGPPILTHQASFPGSAYHASSSGSVYQVGFSSSLYQAASPRSAYHARQPQLSEAIKQTGVAPKSTLVAPKITGYSGSAQRKHDRCLQTEQFKNQLSRIACSRKTQDLASKEKLVGLPHQVADLNSIKTSAQDVQHEPETLRAINLQELFGRGSHVSSSYHASKLQEKQPLNPRDASGKPFLYRKRVGNALLNAKGVPNALLQQEAAKNAQSSLRNYEKPPQSLGCDRRVFSDAYVYQQRSTATNSQKQGVPAQGVDLNADGTSAANFRRNIITPIDWDGFSGTSTISCPSYPALQQEESVSVNPNKDYSEATWLHPEGLETDMSSQRIPERTLKPHHTHFQLSSVIPDGREHTTGSKKQKIGSSMHMTDFHGLKKPIIHIERGISVSNNLGGSVSRPGPFRINQIASVLQESQFDTHSMDISNDLFLHPKEAEKGQAIQRDPADDLESEKNRLISGKSNNVVMDSPMSPNEQTGNFGFVKKSPGKIEQQYPEGLKKINQRIFPQNTKDSSNRGKGKIVHEQGVSGKISLSQENSLQVPIIFIHDSARKRFESISVQVYKTHSFQYPSLESSGKSRRIYGSISANYNKGYENGVEFLKEKLKVPQEKIFFQEKATQGIIPTRKPSTSFNKTKARWRNYLKKSVPVIIYDISRLCIAFPQLPSHCKSTTEELQEDAWIFYQTIWKNIDDVLLGPIELNNWSKNSAMSTEEMYQIIQDLTEERANKGKEGDLKRARDLLSLWLSWKAPNLYEYVKGKKDPKVNYLFRSVLNDFYQI